MQLEYQTWGEVTNYLKTRADILIPIGSIEQHGPTGLLGTDSMTANAIAILAGQKDDTMVAPGLNIGMSLHHLGFKGTISLKPTTLIEVIKDVVFSLHQAGFCFFTFVNGHGGNESSLECAFSEVHEKHPIRCQKLSWYKLDAVKTRISEVFGDKEGGHAACSEISITKHLFRDKVKDFDSNCPPASNDQRFFGSNDFKQRFIDGRVGSDPSGVAEAGGKIIYELAAAEIASYHAEFIEYSGKTL